MEKTYGPEIDPLRQVRIPREKMRSDGTITFRTSDKQQYNRLVDGSIRRTTQKVNGREARRIRARQRRLGEKDV